MKPNPITYIELPTTSIAETKRFYAEAFGWSYNDFGDDYAEIANAGLHGGINANVGDRTKLPLVLLQTDNIEQMEEQVRSAGGRVTVPLFSYPGGRRFHFTDPAGNELGVYQPA